MANNNEGGYHRVAAAAAVLPAASRNNEQAPLSAATRGRGRRSPDDHHHDDENGSSLWATLVRLFLGRRDVDHLPPTLLPDDDEGGGGGGGGEYRLALNASTAQKTCGRGYYFMDAKTLSLPPPMHEHATLFASLYNKIVTAQGRHNRKGLPTILLLLCPFMILLFTPVTVAIATGDTEDDIGDTAVANNPFFLTAFVLSFSLPFLLIGPCTKTATKEYEAELERIVEESAAEWSATTDYRLSLEYDHRCPKLVYLCFRRAATASPPRENLEPNGSSTAEEEAAAASGLEIL